MGCDNFYPKAYLKLNLTTLCYMFNIFALGLMVLENVFVFFFVLIPEVSEKILQVSPIIFSLKNDSWGRVNFDPMGII